MKKHSESISVDDEYKCDECDKVFPTKAGFKAHQLQHTGGHPFKCQHCGIGFSQRSTLLVHEKMHEGNAHSQCDICDREFKNVTALAFHMKIHNTKQGKPFKCSQCSKCFAIE